MRKLIGVILTIALGVFALGVVPVSANNDGATDTWHGDVPTGVPCSFDGAFASIGVVGGPAHQTLHRWKGDTVNLTCWFKGLDTTGWDGTTLLTGFNCSIASNPDSPNQGIVFTNDTSLRINGAGNAKVTCTSSP